MKYAAYIAESERRFARQFEQAYARLQRELADWQIGRILTTARLLDMPPETVTPGDIVVCNVEHGTPPLDTETPRIRPDRRYKLPEPPGAPFRNADGGTK